MTALQPAGNNYLALDVGDARVGVAFAHKVARLPRPLITLKNNETVWDELNRVIVSEGVGTVVVGLPRNLSGDDTSQTEKAKVFAKKLKERYDIPVLLQDEALTSRKAEEELKRRGHYEKGDIDALAATYILEDYLAGSER